MSSWVDMEEEMQLPVVSCQLSVESTEGRICFLATNNWQLATYSLPYAPSFSNKYAFTLSSATRSCFMESRSRRVTVWSSLVWPSIVMQ